MKLKVLCCLLLLLVARCMKKGFLLNKPREQKQRPTKDENIKNEKEIQSFKCNICNKNRFVSCAPPCAHKMCGKCATEICYAENLNDACAICGVEVPHTLKEYKVNFHNFDDLKADEYLSASHCSIFEGNLPLSVQKIASLGFDLKSYPRAVIHAAAGGHLEIVKFLAEQKVDLQTLNGLTPLYIAAQNGHEKIVEFLIEEGGVAVDKMNSERATPLFAASLKGHLTIVTFLAKHGADIDHAREDGATPLFGAVYEGHMRVVKFLVQNGADVDKGRIGEVTIKDIAQQNTTEVHQEIALYLSNLKKKKE